MDYFALTCPDFTPDDFGCWIIVLHHSGGWIALTQRGIAGSPDRSVSGLPVPRRFQCFAKAKHKADVKARIILHEAGKLCLQAFM
jgi:hypothetical protein